MIRFFLAPYVPHPTRKNGRIVKYFHQELVGHVKFNSEDYGREHVAYVVADLGKVELDFLAKKPDIVLFPRDLSKKLTLFEANCLEKELESRRMPAHWVDPILSWSMCLRTISRFIEMGQVLHARGNVSLAPRVLPLDAPTCALPERFRHHVSNAAGAFGCDTRLPKAMPYRETVKRIADQFPPEKFYPIGAVLYGASGY